MLYLPTNLVQLTGFSAGYSLISDIKKASLSNSYFLNFPWLTFGFSFLDFSLSRFSIVFCSATSFVTSFSVIHAISSAWSKEVHDICVIIAYKIFNCSFGFLTVFLQIFWFWKETFFLQRTCQQIGYECNFHLRLNNISFIFDNFYAFALWILTVCIFKLCINFRCYFSLASVIRLCRAIAKEWRAENFA